MGEAIEDVKEDIKAMKKTRKEENKEFLQAKKDDQDAIKLLVKARKFLKDYYEKNKNKEDLQEELDYKKEIQPDCDWIIGAFEKRAKLRTAEMDGLVEAKEFLAGASTEEASLVQKVGKLLLE